MTKQHKSIFGFLGLLVVAFTTVFAANLSPIFAAGGTTYVTDTISVRVIGSTPEILITNPKSTDGKPIELTNPFQTVTVRSINVDTKDFYLTYTDLDGNVTEEHISL